MTKSLIFDAGPIISLSMNNLLWTLEPLKEQFRGEFYITAGVEYELVGKPLNNRMFKLHALQVAREIRKGTLKVIPSRKIQPLAESIITTSNSCFSAHDQNIRILQWGECEVLAAAHLFGANAIIVDERTTMMLLERPHQLQRLLEKKNHTPVRINEENLHRLMGLLKGIKALRSVELMMIAYELGLFKDLLLPGQDASRTLLDAMLWGLKIQGCAISPLEMARLLKHEARR